jgi:hypothetical protein
MSGNGWHGHNSGVIQGLTTGPSPIELAGSSFLSVPRPVGAERERHAVFDLVDKPQGACRCHAQTERRGADDAVSLPTRISPQPITGMGVTDGTVHGPAVVLLVEDGVGA